MLDATADNAKREDFLDWLRQLSLDRDLRAPACSHMARPIGAALDRSAAVSVQSMPSERAFEVLKEEYEVAPQSFHHGRPLGEGLGPTTVRHPCWSHGGCLRCLGRRAIAGPVAGRTLPRVDCDRA